MEQSFDSLFGFHFWNAGLISHAIDYIQLDHVFRASFLVRRGTMSGLQMQAMMIDSVRKACQGIALHAAATGLFDKH